MIARRLAAEGIGTAFLLMAIVGSGIVVGDEPSAALALFIHAIIIGATLTALILTFGPVSGAHFNPVVTTVDAIFGGLSRGLAAGSWSSSSGWSAPGGPARSPRRWAPTSPAQSSSRRRTRSRTPR